MNDDQLCVPFKQENLMLNSSGLKSIELPIVLKDGLAFPSFKRFYHYVKEIYQEKNIATCCRKTFVSRIKKGKPVDEAIRTKQNPSKNSVGKKYNYLTVIKITGTDKAGNAIVLARCSGNGDGCIKEKEYYLSSIRSGDTKSCGCMSSALRSENNTHRNYLFKLENGQEYHNPMSVYTIVKNKLNNSEIVKYSTFSHRVRKFHDRHIAIGDERVEFDYSLIIDILKVDINFELLDLVYQVYVIKCKSTRKEYVGVTANPIETRMYEHVRRSLKNKTKITKNSIGESLKKYGKAEHTIDMIKCFDNVEDALDFEKNYIKENDLIEQGLNSSKGGEFCRQSFVNKEQESKIGELVMTSTLLYEDIALMYGTTVAGVSYIVKKLKDNNKFGGRNSKPFKLNDDEKETFVNLLRDGKTNKEIGEFFGVTVDQVDKKVQEVKKEGLIENCQRKHNVKLTGDDSLAVLEFSTLGFSKRKIGSVFGVSHKSIEKKLKVLAKNGINPSQKGHIEKLLKDKKLDFFQEDLNAFIELREYGYDLNKICRKLRIPIKSICFIDKLISGMDVTKGCVEKLKIEGRLKK